MAAAGERGPGRTPQARGVLSIFGKMKLVTSWMMKMTARAGIVCRSKKGRAQRLGHGPTGRYDDDYQQAIIVITCK
jgi:hypothetical protein